MTVITEEIRRAGWYLGESAALNLINEAITVLDDSGIVHPGTVLGKVIVESEAAALEGNAANTGTFVLDVDDPVLAEAMPGIYKLRCIATATNGGTFRLTAPDGTIVGDFTISGGAGGTAAVNSHIKGVITDAATDFSAGEGFDISVGPGVKYGPHDPDAVNGLNVAAAILYAKVDATDNDAPGVATVRGPATIAKGNLTFKTGITDAAKAAALAALKNNGMIPL